MNVEAHVTRPMTISVSAACKRVNKDRTTIARWCKHFGIGKQIEKGAEWRIDPIALVMIADGDRDALWAYQLGEMNNPLVLRYLTA